MKHTASFHLGLQCMERILRLPEKKYAESKNVWRDSGSYFQRDSQIK